LRVPDDFRRRKIQELIARRREDLSQLVESLAETRRLRREVERLEAELLDRSECLDECELRNERDEMEDFAFKAGLVAFSIAFTLLEQQLQTVALECVQRIAAGGSVTLSSALTGLTMPFALGGSAFWLRKAAEDKNLL
jgi:antitoxin (DNA-binding transcriptional repressor) of toxin-antitoxin stability system